MAWGSHMSNFHRVTQYGSKIRHRSMTGVTCDTTHHGSCQLVFAVSKNNPHRGGILTCAHMLPPSSQRKSSQREDFELGSHASHHLKNNPPKGRIPKRWDKNPVQEILPEGRIIDRILLIEGYLHVSTFYSGHGGHGLELGVFWDIHMSPVHDQVSVSLPLVQSKRACSKLSEGFDYCVVIACTSPDPFHQLITSTIH